MDARDAEGHEGALQFRDRGDLRLPAAEFYCRDDINSVDDLKGKKIRVQGVSQSDLAKAFGASAVTIPFGEVVPALEKGVVDCGITGTMPGYKAKWTEVVKTLFRCRSASPPASGS